jgi:hypothetical protein
VLDLRRLLHGRLVGVAARVARVLAGQVAGGAGERGGEQQRLAVGRRAPDDALEVGAEAHVHHAVGLVEDEDADAAEVDVAAVHEVEQAARRRRPSRWALRASLAWRSMPDAAVDGGDGEAAGLGDVAGVVDDLAGELARRGEDERGGARDRSGSGRSRIGRTKASVLPEPVGDSARTSWPSSASGMTSVWTAKGAGDAAALEGARRG